MAHCDTQFQPRVPYDSLLLIKEGKGATVCLAQLCKHLVSSLDANGSAQTLEAFSPSFSYFHLEKV